MTLLLNFACVIFGKYLTNNRYLLCHDVWHNRVFYSYIALVINSFLHAFYTRTCTNLHISTVSTLDKHNFIYNSTLLWN